MKNLIKISLVFTFFISVVVNASDRFNVAITGPEMIQISLVNIKAGEALSIKDLKGNLVFNKALSEMDSFEKNFSLYSLRKGVYFVEIDSEKYIKVIPVVKNKLGVSLLDNATKTIFKPQFSYDDNLLLLNVTNNEEKEVNIAIYDTDGELLIREEGVLSELIKRSYDTSELPVGKYSIAVKKGTRSFLKEFFID